MSKVRTAREYERRVADRLGGKHIVKKHYGDHQPDISHPLFTGECKLRKELAVDTWLKQVEDFTYEKFGVVICKVKGRPDNESICCMRIGDFEQLLREHTINTLSEKVGW